MPKLAVVVQILGLLALSAILAWLGVSVPVHFKAVSPALIERAGEGTASLGSLTLDLMDAGRVGPVRLIWKADARLPSTETERLRIRDVFAQQPLYWHSGGPAPYYESFLRAINPPTGSQHERNVVEMIIPRQNRATLLGFLDTSTNSTVQRLLQLRDLTGWRTFMPVFTPAGHPLDASILVTALLVQSDSMPQTLRRELQTRVVAALEGDSHPQAELERDLLAILALGRRLDWVQLEELFSVLDSSTELRDAAARLSRSPTTFPQVYAAALLLEDYAPVETYLVQYPDDGLEALQLALWHGRGSLKMLVEQGKPLYHPPLIVRWLDKPLSQLRDLFLLGFALEHPGAAINLKIVLLLLAGFMLALSAGRIEECLGVFPPASRTRPLVLSACSAAAITFTVLLWMLVEPNLLEFGEEKTAEISLDFGIALPQESLNAQDIASAMTDQSTIIVLLLFFFLQLVVYVFGLLKIAQIRRQKHLPGTKLQLLENEEYLFDLGLYIGLGGTVTSLVMLAMNIVQTSLVAAYSSTLFGIIFTAFLKIVNVRPFRRNLILQSLPGADKDQ